MADLIDINNGDTGLQARDKINAGLTQVNENTENLNSLSKSVATAAGKLVSKMEENTGDGVVFVASDSTGNESTEWVYLYAQWLYEEYPAFTVDYYLFNSSTGDYNSAVNIGSGSGDYTVSIYNAAISGSKPDYIMGERFDNAVKNIPQADLFILNHGHNMVSSYFDDDVERRRSPQFLEALETIKRVHSNCGVIMLAQNPLRDNDDYSPIYRTIVDVAGLINADLADVYSLFIEQNKDSSLYQADGLHPSALGTELFLIAVTKLHNSKAFKGSTSSLDQTSLGFLVNGDFASFDATVPDNWEATNCLTTKDTINWDGYNEYAVNLTPTLNTEAGYITQSVNSKYFRSLKGYWVTLAVRVFIPSTGRNNNSGRIVLRSDSQSQNTYTASAEASDGWQWRTLALKMEESDTYLQVRLYADAGAGGGTAIFDRAVLVRGRLPKDII